jgi:uncharacterized protein
MTQDVPTGGGKSQGANRLAFATSPYLLQHARNPVDWYPWGEEALARARTEDKPIFLSVGYSSCHWCHVMEHESFENHQIAAFVNAHFVAIKVDREERPDIDETYMKAVQLMTGSGGWPMTVFLTPELEPFYGGTYFPPTDRYGRPGFLSVLNHIATVWREQRQRAIDSAKQLREHVARLSGAATTPRPATEATIAATVDSLTGYFDKREGGFGGAPKFPHPMDLAFLLRVFARGDVRVGPMVEFTLDKMGRGGIYDQIGGGFHRYATDERWLVPHFEKMLYDNALLAPVYADAARTFDSAFCERIARETCDYVLREMTDEGGGFWSATDADSEGEEGKFFVWTKREVVAVLGAGDGESFARHFGMSDGGNFEHGANVLEQVGPETDRKHFAPQIAKLLAVRSKRIAPGLDDKVLVEWNGLMIAALARCGATFGEVRYVAAAERAAAFILDRMCEPRQGSLGLLRSYRNGRAHIAGFLSDHANLIHGLLELCAVSPNPRWLAAARALTAEVLERFGAEDGGFYATSAEHERLLTRSRDPFDNATPSGNSVMATNLLRLAHWTADASLGEAGERTIAAFAPLVEDAPAGFGWMMQAVDLMLYEPTAVVIVGAADSKAASDFVAAAHRKFRRGVFVLRTDGSRAADPDAPEILRNRPAPDQGAAVYVCRGGACLAPPRDPVALEAALESIVR